MINRPNHGSGACQALAPVYSRDMIIIASDLGSAKNMTGDKF